MMILFLLIQCYLLSDIKAASTPVPTDLRQSMRDFISGISKYAKTFNPNFLIIPQNGQEVAFKSGRARANELDQDFIAAIDGWGREDLHYGYPSIDNTTPNSEKNYITSYMDILKGKIPILVTDYCRARSKVDESYRINKAKGFISFAADQRELTTIPAYPQQIIDESANDINSLNDVKNFLYLLNAEKFKTRENLLQALSNTNYDMLLIDAFPLAGSFLKPNEAKRLKKKANGGKRLLIAYMSIGEAEDYRWYWKKEWKECSPAFLTKENPDWRGNFKVRYWDAEWQRIIFGENNSYTKQIIDAGFDGIYLDIIDGFEYFMENPDQKSCT